MTWWVLVSIVFGRTCCSGECTRFLGPSSSMWLEAQVMSVFVSSGSTEHLYTDQGLLLEWAASPVISLKMVFENQHASKKGLLFFFFLTECQSKAQNVSFVPVTFLKCTDYKVKRPVFHSSDILPSKWLLPPLTSFSGWGGCLLSYYISFLGSFSCLIHCHARYQQRICICMLLWCTLDIRGKYHGFLKCLMVISLHG